MKLKPELLLLYKEGRLSHDEKREVEEFLSNQPDENRVFGEFDELGESLESWGQMHRVRGNVLQAVRQESAQPNVIHLPQFRGAAIPTAVAACFVIALTGLYFMMQNQDATFTELDRQGTVVISQNQIDVESDGFLSIKMADQKSVTEYAPNTIAMITGVRSLFIETGKVWNEVGKDDGNQYTVTTQHGTIIVLGTQFEVEVNNDKTTVRLLEGSVKLVHTDGSEQLLNPNEEAVMKPASKIQLTQITADDIAKWRGSFIGKGFTTRDVPNVLQQTKNR
ncbi:MAG: FecR family protein [Candidatus Hinthialibacter antarcticus]|nr:FecR family protein [Candidatus Hinthialibacter antarcticus]